MSILQVQVLGRPEACLGGPPLCFRTRRALALLIYLAVEGGLHARETLAALLSPHHDPERARTMLRHTLAALRQALGEHPSDPGAGYLVSTPEALGLDLSAALALDVQTLQAALTPPPPALSAERRTRLAGAVGLVRGPFLQGFALPQTPAFAEWVDAQRALWQRRVDLACDQLSELLALRLEELAVRVPLAGWLAALEREATHLTLAPLSAADTTRLVAELASVSGGAVAEPAVAGLSAQLFARTGGHPFFLLETLKVWCERQARPADEELHADGLLSSRHVLRG